MDDVYLENDEELEDDLPIEVSFITVNFNGYEDTCEMIDSIAEYVHGMTYEIIVVDNDSDIDELPLILEVFPFVRGVQNLQNDGFAVACNLGAAYARGKYLFFLNNDTFVTDNGIRSLIDRLESDSSIGGVSPMLRYADEAGLVQFAGFTPLSRITLRNRSIGNGEAVDESFLTACETPYLHGAAMMVKAEVFAKVGGLPTHYFLYYEELDWSLTIRQYGYRLWYEPKCVIFHKESRSTGIDSPQKVFYMTRNRFLFAYRNTSAVECFFTHLYLLLVVAVRDYRRYRDEERIDLLEAMREGIRDYYALTEEQKMDKNEFRYSTSLL